MWSAEAENYIRNKGVNQGRVVLHSDLNNFFASVECLKHKELAAYPVAVCGNKEERHGIVLAKNNLKSEVPLFLFCLKKERRPPVIAEKQDAA